MGKGGGGGGWVVAGTVTFGQRGCNAWSDITAAENVVKEAEEEADLSATLVRAGAVPVTAQTFTEEDERGIHCTVQYIYDLEVGCLADGERKAGLRRGGRACGLCRPATNWLHFFWCDGACLGRRLLISLPVTVARFTLSPIRQVPADFVPVNVDGEVEEFALMPMGEVLDAVVNEEFKVRQICFLASKEAS